MELNWSHCSRCSRNRLFTGPVLFWINHFKAHVRFFFFLLPKQRCLHILNSNILCFFFQMLGENTFPLGLPSQRSPVFFLWQRYLSCMVETLMTTRCFLRGKKKCFFVIECSLPCHFIKNVNIYFFLFLRLNTWNMTQYFERNLQSADVNSFFLQPIVSLRGCDRTETRLMMFS